jgi:hypothetical protein
MAAQGIYNLRLLRTLKTAADACRVSLLTATKRMVGRIAASQSPPQHHSFAA